jgi:hypothetical protein
MRTLITILITWAKSLIDLVTAILKARSDSVKGRDCVSKSFELVVRRADEKRGIHEEVVLRLSRWGTGTTSRQIRRKAR